MLIDPAVLPVRLGPRHRTAAYSAMPMDHEMTIADVHGVLDLCDELGITVWMDGGWGVDALLGTQTRPHRDLDIVIRQEHAGTLEDRLRRNGFDDVATDDQSEWNFVLADPDARRVDFHLIVIDDRGNGIYGPAEHGDVYPAASLAAMGRIGGRAVRCLTPEYQVESHTGYEIGATDRHDVLALHERFGVPLPPEYRSG